MNPQHCQLPVRPARSSPHSRHVPRPVAQRLAAASGEREQHTQECLDHSLSHLSLQRSQEQSPRPPPQQTPPPQCLLRPPPMMSQPTRMAMQSIIGQTRESAEDGSVRFASGLLAYQRHHAMSDAEACHSSCLNFWLVGRGTTFRVATPPIASYSSAPNVAA